MTSRCIVYNDLDSIIINPDDEMEAALTGRFTWNNSEG